MCVRFSIFKALCISQYPFSTDLIIIILKNYFIIFIIIFRSVPPYLQWLSDLSWFKYAFEAYMINQWSDIDHIKCQTNSSANSICVTTGIQVLHKQFISLVSINLSMEILFSLFSYFSG